MDQMPVYLEAESLSEYLDKSDRSDRAVTTLVHLLAGFPARPCPRKADAILNHLLLVARDARQPEELRKVAADAIEDWQQMLGAALGEGVFLVH